MKKMLFTLPLVLLAVFFSGCGKTPDEELQSSSTSGRVNSIFFMGLAPLFFFGFRRF